MRSCVLKTVKYAELLKAYTGIKCKQCNPAINTTWCIYIFHVIDLSGIKNKNIQGYTCHRLSLYKFFKSKIDLFFLMNIVRGRILNHQFSPWSTVTSKTWNVKMAHAQFIKIPIHKVSRLVSKPCLSPYDSKKALYPFTAYLLKNVWESYAISLRVISLIRRFPESISYCLHFSLHRDIRRRHLF